MSTPTRRKRPFWATAERVPTSQRDNPEFQTETLSAAPIPDLQFLDFPHVVGHSQQLLHHQNERERAQLQRQRCE